jgi:hypothetical protein
MRHFGHFTARPPFGQKIVPIFSFFLFGPGNLNYDKPRKSRVILIMGREN